MKLRFSSLDVKIIAHELSKSLCALRLSNVYDISSRVFLLKFAKPDHRELLLIDSGFRCHLTKFSRNTAAAPSAFVSRLRKYLRTRRLTSVTQVGTDRIIELQFSEGQYRLFVEFYAGGNIILTDRELTILVLLRTVGEGDGQEQLQVGLKYGLDSRQNFDGVPPLTKERVRNGLLRAIDKQSTQASNPARKARKRPGDTLRAALATSVTELPPMLIDHAFLLASFDPSTRIEDIVEDDTVLEQLMLVLEEARNVMAHITELDVTKGYIVARTGKEVRPGHTFGQSTDLQACSDEDEFLLYEDFQPFRPRKFEGLPDTRVIEIQGYNATADKFFSSIEAQRIESRLTERELNAKSKLDAARQDYHNRVGEWRLVQELNIRKALLIEANLSRVQEAIAAINGLIAQGMDWVEIARLIEMEQIRGNSVAEMIKLPLKLYENTITLLLAEAHPEEAEDAEGDETGSDVSDSENEPDKAPEQAAPIKNRLAVDVDLALSPWSNARQYYEQKKTAAVKEQKTLQSSVVALRNTEKKINSDLKKGLRQEKEVLRPLKRQMWFEKFYYFISSDGYLVLAGRDAQQNEILYNKFLRKGDVYVCADLDGATSVIIKNKATMCDSPIPPTTLTQAGTLAVASSGAWESKAIMAAWWVNAEQVSKIALTGEYLNTGAFIIEGQKNFLPPAHLLLGFGLMFIVSESSKVRHLKHRLPYENAKAGTEQSVVEQRYERDRRYDDDTIADESNRDSKPPLEKDGAAEVVAENAGRQSVDHDDYSDQMSDQAFRDITYASNANPLAERFVSKEESEAEDEREGSEAESDGTDRDCENDENSREPRAANPLQRNGYHSNPALLLDHSQPQGMRDTKLQALPTISRNFIAESGSDHSESEMNSHSDQLHIATLTTRHLSVKEKPLLHKGPTTSSSFVSGQQSADSAYDGSPPSETASGGPVPSLQKHSPSLHVRGKHGQRNKQKNKYGHQDDEDRAVALRLLGSMDGQNKSAAEASVKAARDVELATQKERRRQQHLRIQQVGKEREEIRRRDLEAGTKEMSQEEVQEMGLLENVVGTPLPGDEVLDVLVVCGPWEAMGSRLKWRAKMQPGTTKKGKVVREILGAWGRTAAEMEKGRTGEGAEVQATLRREGELIRGLREAEIVGFIPVGKCRLVLGSGERSRGGGAKLKRGGKGTKKL